MRRASYTIFALLFCIAPGLAIAGNATGSWDYHGPAESGMWLLTEQQGQTVHFQLETQRGAPSYNSGWIEGAFELHGDSGTFKSTEYGACEITFKFINGSVQLQQSGEDYECGFGHNVFAEGTLRLKSRKRPKLSKDDPRFGDE
jgi:hypothetical protein